MGNGSGAVEVDPAGGSDQPVYFHALARGMACTLSPARVPRAGPPVIAPRDRQSAPHPQCDCTVLLSRLTWRNQEGSKYVLSAAPVNVRRDLDEDRS